MEDGPHTVVYYSPSPTLLLYRFEDQTTERERGAVYLEVRREDSLWEE